MSNPFDLFIIHVRADATVASKLALDLERLGYRSWWHWLDSLPLGSDIENIRRGIETASVLLVLVSPDSLHWHGEVTREIHFGQAAAKPFIPLVLDLSDAEFDHRVPITWRQAFGEAVRVRVEPGRLEPAAGRIAAGLSALGVNPRAVDQADPRIRTLEEMMRPVGSNPRFEAELKRWLEAEPRAAPVQCDDAGVPTPAAPVWETPSLWSSIGARVRSAAIGVTTWVRSRVRRRARGVMPYASVDEVHFTVTAPSVLRPDTSYVLGVWAHLDRLRDEALHRARTAEGGRPLSVRSKGPAQVARGTVLRVRLRAEGLLVEDAEDVINWQGGIGNATFPVRVPAGAAPGSLPCRVTVHIDGVEIMRIHFVLVVGAEEAPLREIEVSEERHRKAFASYASEDRRDVLARIQGILKAAPTLEVFLDVLSLRSGENWAEKLWMVVPSSDVFYLFWSEHARASPWVEREWRCALETRGIDFIDPVPLVDPDRVPPPAELASKYFNDWVLAFMAARPDPSSGS
jgi:hypothetical protein